MVGGARARDPPAIDGTRAGMIDWCEHPERPGRPGPATWDRTPKVLVRTVGPTGGTEMRLSPQGGQTVSHPTSASPVATVPLREEVPR